MFKKILVPTDGSELSTKAVAAAVSLARECGAAVVVLSVQPIYRPPIVAEVPVADVYTQAEYEEGARRIGQATCERVEAVARQSGVACTSVVHLDASPWEGIIRVAEAQRCDLIFMASHGRRGVVGMLLGSETQKVLTHCKIPVLVHR